MELLTNLLKIDMIHETGDPFNGLAAGVDYHRVALIIQEE
jgi:hypothetical protein